MTSHMMMDPIGQLEAFRNDARVTLGDDAAALLNAADRVIKWGQNDAHLVSLQRSRYLLPAQIMKYPALKRVMADQEPAVQAVVASVTPPVPGEKEEVTTGRSMTFRTGAVVGVYPLASAFEKETQDNFALAGAKQLEAGFMGVANMYYHHADQTTDLGEGTANHNTYDHLSAQSTAMVHAANYFIGMFEGLEPYAAGAEACGASVGIPRDHMRIGYGIGAATVGLPVLERQIGYDEFADTVNAVPIMPPAPARPYDIVGLPGFSETTSNLIIVGK